MKTGLVIKKNMSEKKKSSMHTRKSVADKAFADYIKTNDNLTPENVALANAFVAGARYQRSLF